MEEEWLIIKIFPKYNEDYSDAINNVFSCKKKFLADLEKISDKQETFFLHYADSRMPERPHFKFFVKNPHDLLEFVSWVKKHLKEESVLDIGIFFGFEDKTLKEGIRARKIVKLLESKNISSLVDLKTELEKTDYIKLEDGIGKHYVHNMIGLDYKTEGDLISKSK